MTALVAVYKGKDRLSSRFIAWAQKNGFSHCERVLERIGPMTYLCGSSSCRDDGVRIKTIRLDPMKWELYELPGEYPDGWDWFLKHEGERYDLLGLLGFVFRRIKGLLKAWFCSEAVMASLGFEDPWRFDVAMVVALLRTLGRRVPIE